MRKAKQAVFHWWPQPRQEGFVRACGLGPTLDGLDEYRAPAARVIGYGGSAGGGKTDALLAAGGIGCLRYPGSRWAFFRRKFVELEGLGGAIDRSREMFRGLATYNGQLHRWTFFNGSRLQFCHCHREADVHNYQSQQFDGLLIDEATHFTEYQINYLMTRNRATVDLVVPFAALATNPGNVGHLWFKRWLIDAGTFEEVHEIAQDEERPWVKETHLFIPAKLADNRILEERDPGYRLTLESRPDAIRRALLEGDWDTFIGQVFTEWRRHRHVCEPFKIPVHWTRWRGYDWGYAAPACCLWGARNPDTGQTYVYREMYKPELTDPDQAQEIRRLTGEPRYEPVKHDERDELLEGSYIGKTIVKRPPPVQVGGELIEATLADPSMWTVRTTEQKTVTSADVFRKWGVPLTKADNQRLIGKRRVHDALMWQDRGTGKALYPDGRPGLQFFEGCPNGIRTLPALPYDELRVEDVDTKAEDHWYDALRYLLSYKVMGARVDPHGPEDAWAMARRAS